MLSLSSLGEVQPDLSLMFVSISRKRCENQLWHASCTSQETLFQPVSPPSWDYFWLSACQSRGLYGDTSVWGPAGEAQGCLSQICMWKMHGVGGSPVLSHALLRIVTSFVWDPRAAECWVQVVGLQLEPLSCYSQVTASSHHQEVIFPAEIARPLWFLVFSLNPGVFLTHIFFHVSNTQVFKHTRQFIIICWQSRT